MTRYFAVPIYLSLVALLALNTFLLSGFASENNPGNPDVDIPKIDRRNYSKVRTATFALGCFWGGDARFGAVPGVIRTRVGYAGGTKEDPTYYDLGDHTESIQLDYDPEEVTLEELLEIFWDFHNPHSRNYSRQYANILFYHNDRQRKIAEDSKSALAESSEKEIYTEIKELEKFYPAEDYHQKYRLRQSQAFMDELGDIYEDPDNLRDSTAAARLNGFLAGYGTPEQVREVLGRLGLSKRLQEKLAERFE